MLGSGDSSHIVKLRGLPFSTTVDDVLEFLEGVEVVNGKEGVHLTEVRPGRPSGECYVEVSTQEDVDTALKKDKENMGSRYIEVFSTNQKDMEWAINAMRQSENGFGGIPFVNDNVGVVKLRGLPFGCSKEEIVQFFDGLPVSEDGVHLLLDHTGRASGEAFVQFPDKGAAQEALSRDREKIGHRYIEVFKSTPDEVRSYGSRGGDGFRSSRVYRPTPYDRNDRFQGGRFGRGGGRGGYVTCDQNAPSELTMEEQLKHCEEDLKYTETQNEILMLELDERNAERESALDRIRFLEEQLKEAHDRLLAPSAHSNYDKRNYSSYMNSHPDKMMSGNLLLSKRMMSGNLPLPPRSTFSSGGYGGGYGGGLGGGRGGFRGRGGGGGFCVHMRGLPFKASPQDIAYFFKPVRPLDINILYDNSGRPSGEADVEFECHEDAMRAMRRDKNNMDSRYIELFLNSSPGGGGGGGGGFKPNRNFRNY